MSKPCDVCVSWAMEGRCDGAVGVSSGWGAWSMSKCRAALDGGWPHLADALMATSGVVDRASAARWRSGLDVGAVAAIEDVLAVSGMGEVGFVGRLVECSMGLTIEMLQGELSDLRGEFAEVRAALEALASGRPLEFAHTKLVDAEPF